MERYLVELTGDQLERVFEFTFIIFLGGVDCFAHHATQAC